MSQKLNDITFTLGEGGSGRQADGADYISALMFFNNTRPTGFTDNYSSGGVHQIFSPADANLIGIDDLHADETQSTGTIQITAIGANGDTIEAKVTDWVGTTSLGTYTKVSGDTTATLVAVGLKNAINAGTNTHGYVATSAIDVVTIKAPLGIGTYFNTGSPYSTTIVGTITRTIVQNVIVGIASKIAVYYYHIQRYFAMRPDGSLFIGIFNTSGATLFADLNNISVASNNSVVQCGIWDDTQVFALAQLTAIQTQLDTMRAANNIISSVIYSADIKAVSTPLTTLSGVAYNLATLTAKNVSSLIDNDGAGLGYSLFKQVGKTISSLGACIGCISEAAISEDFGNCIDRFNCDDGVEFDTLMFGDGTLYANVSVTTLNALNNNRYVFLSKVPHTSGSWYSDDHTAITLKSDYAYVHDNRIIDRVIKNTFTALTPFLKKKFKLNTNGTMQTTTIAGIIATVSDQVIRPLITSEDLAGDPDNFDGSKWVLVSPSQLINTAGKLIVGIKLAENGIAHSISVPVGFGTFN